ncbi:receptor-type tyrosine-protein phosphatase N2-like [Oscarella lobularis]|uniref:receptor-type tyrosine-protein phosphatase N2-like n=1 Tax=Oscarella lobularis TaxID=121494 RepID=UPI0033140FB5
MQRSFLLLFLVASLRVSHSWRYGCTFFGSLCSRTEQCDTAFLLGECTSNSHVTKRATRDSGEDEPLYVFVRFNLKDCNGCSIEADQVISTLARHVGLKEGIFKEIKGSGDVVTFEVGENESGMEAEKIAHMIENDKDAIGQTIGMTITECGTTNKIAINFYEEEEEKEDDSFFSFGNIVLLLIGIMLLSIILTIVTVGTIVLIMKKRHAEKSYASGTYMIKPKVSMPEEDLTSYEMLVRERHQLLVKSEDQDAKQENEKKLGTKKLESPQQGTATEAKWQDEPVKGHLDVTAGHLILDYLEELCENEDKITEDWAGLCTYVADDVATETGEDLSNRSKNRYADVLPYDHNRVVLDKENNVSGSDYINASYIFDVNPRKAKYIAAQGPVESTVADFWQMVWEQECVAIVMLTQLEDAGLSQCYQYWPERDMKIYDIYEVHLSSEHLLWDDYRVRTIFLKNLNTQETRTITQFHFITWPNLSVPSDPKSLLELRRKVKGSFTGQECPIIVHDSAGVGRTGTYILIDIVLDRIQGSKIKEIDLAATVEHLRDQRMQMVKNKEQFEFALKAVVEEVQAILTAMPSPSGTYNQFKETGGAEEQ